MSQLRHPSRLATGASNPLRLGIHPGIQVPKPRALFDDEAPRDRASGPDLLESHLASLPVLHLQPYRELACRHGPRTGHLLFCIKEMEKKTERDGRRKGETGSDAAWTTGYLVRRGDIKSTTKRYLPVYIPTNVKIGIFILMLVVIPPHHSQNGGNPYPFFRRLDVKNALTQPSDILASFHERQSYPVKPLPNLPARSALCFWAVSTEESMIADRSQQSLRQGSDAVHALVT